MIAPVAKIKKKDLIWLSLHKCKHRHSFLEHYECFLKEMPRQEERIGFLDIEASQLNADFGFILCYAIKERKGPIILRVATPKEIRSGEPDKRILKQFVTDARTFDRLVVYYGTDHRFDIPFLRTRALYYGLNFPSLREIKVTDVYPMVRNKLRLHRNRLESAIKFFGIPGKEHELLPGVWMRATVGDKKAIDWIAKHNIEDVESLEKLFELLVPFVNVIDASI